MIQRVLSYWRIRNLILAMLYQDKSVFVSKIGFYLWIKADEVGV
jgi:hypothetical protein